MERKDSGAAQDKQHEKKIEEIKRQIRKNRKASKGQRTAIGLLLGFVICFTGLWIYFTGIADVNLVSKSDYSQYEKAVLLQKYAEENFYQDVDSKDLKEGMYKGVIEGLDDPYSSYMTADEYESWKVDTTGEFEGAGVTITMAENGYAEVVSVIDDSPAKKAGIQPGDYLVSVDGKEYSTLEEIVSKIRGEAGTSVKIEYVRDGKRNTVEIVREKLRVESVTSDIKDGNIGYVRISQFAERTGDDFCKAVRKLEKKKVKGMIIDLRNNGGGLVSEAVKVADELLPESTIVRCKNREGKEKAYKSDAHKTGLKYVLLVDGATASASEIVTAAVKDNNGGKIVGTKTFGKGVIQSTVQLTDGSAVKLTILQYISPDGHRIHKEGINPDKIVKYSKSDKKDNQLAAAKALLK